jgi:two-component system chemotaxis response regulator CheY
MRILVVDDNIGYLDVMAQLLRDYGYQVVGAEDGRQAREFLDINNVDLIISDVFMPTLNGVRFHDYVREFTRARDVPFIFISAYDHEHMRSLVVNSDIDFFFSKATPFETIVDLIEQLRVVNETPQHHDWFENIPFKAAAP